MPMKTWKNGRKKLLRIHNQQYFSLLAWLPKRPIFGRNRNLIGSPCLLSTISLIIDKNRHFLTPSPSPHLVHVVIECPLRVNHAPWLIQATMVWNCFLCSCNCIFTFISFFYCNMNMYYANNGYGVSSSGIQS
jgi:hypothetical protein